MGQAVDVTYEIQVLEVDRPEWLSDLRRAVAAELSDVGAHRVVEVSVVEGVRLPVEKPTVVVALVGPGMKGDDGVAAAVSEAINEGLVVVPVVDSLDGFPMKVAGDLLELNGFAWSGPRPEQALARLLLEELGIEESDRRVFISHCRADGLGAAEQIHDELTKHRFKPFIDRFAIRKGRNVQAEIADALEDFAFLLLLETPEAHLSEWVFYEIDYALSHTMGISIVQWPGEPQSIPGSVRLPRLALRASDIRRSDHAYDVLGDEALDRVVREVEAAHAMGIVRRRRMLLQNVQEAARAGGARCTPMRNWSLDVVGDAGRSVVSVTPRLPSAYDLQELDQTRAAVDPDADAVLVHAARVLEESRRRHLEWVGRNRDLALLPENGIGGYW